MVVAIWSVRRYWWARSLHSHLIFDTQEIRYHIATGKELYKTLNNHDNTSRSGLSIVASLHFGDFAGYSFRVLFFILGLGTCYLILPGNLLWIEKRASQRKFSKFGLRVVKVITSDGFIAARLLPITNELRSEIIVEIFFACLFSAVVLSLLVKQQHLFSKWLAGNSARQWKLRLRRMWKRSISCRKSTLTNPVNKH